MTHRLHERSDPTARAEPSGGADMRRARPSWRAGLRSTWAIRSAVGRLPQAIHEVIHLALSGLARGAVALLDAADELLTLARDAVEVVVGQVAPALLNGTLELLPVALEHV